MSLKLAAWLAKMQNIAKLKKMYFRCCSRAHRYSIVRMAVNTSSSGGHLRLAQLREYKVKFNAK